MRINPPSKVGRIYFLSRGVYSPAGWLAEELGLEVEEDLCIYVNRWEPRCLGTMVSLKLSELGITISPKQVWEYITKWDRIDDEQLRRYTFLTDAYNIMCARSEYRLG